MVLRVLSLNEEDLIRGLRACAALSGGKYPSSLDHETVARAREAWLRERHGQADDLSSVERKKIEEQLLDTFFMAAYYQRLIKDGREPAYYGQTVTVQDSNAVLARWRASEGAYRVVFGDLRVQTVTAERLAELESRASD